MTLSKAKISTTAIQRPPKQVEMLFQRELWRRIGYTPHAKQLEVHNALLNGARFIDVNAGTRSGKTFMLAAIFLNEIAKEPPPNTGLGIIPVIAPYQKLTDKVFRYLWKWIVIEKCFGVMPSKKSERERYIQMPWGMRVDGYTADSPDSLLGEGWVFVGCDEYARFKDSIYSSHIERGLTDYQAPCVRITTPLGRVHHWCDSWSDTYNQMQSDPAYFATTFTSWDNTNLPEGEIQRIFDKYKRQGLERLFRQEFEASFEALEGAVYTNFMPIKDGVPWHVQECEPLPDVPFSIGIDWGTDHPAVAIFGQITGDRIRIIDSIVQSGMSDSIFADAVMARAHKWGIPIEVAYCDPSDPGGKIEFRDKGIPVYEQPKRLKAEGICEINDRKAGPREIIKLFAREDKPAIIIHPRNKILIEQISSIQWGADEKPIKLNDDAHDGFRYLVVGGIAQTCGSRLEIFAF